MRPLLLAGLLLTLGLAAAAPPAEAFYATACVVGNVGSVCTPGLPLVPNLLFCEGRQTPTTPVYLIVFVCV